MITRYRAMRCPCGHQVCKNWFVDPVLAVQCVRFTEKQAHAVADLLNKIELAGVISQKLSPEKVCNDLGLTMINLKYRSSDIIGTNDPFNIELIETTRPIGWEFKYYLNEDDHEARRSIDITSIRQKVRSGWDHTK